MESTSRCQRPDRSRGAGRFWRRRADKRREVEKHLANGGLAHRSDRAIANQLGVSHQLVAAVRRQLGEPHRGAREAQRGAATYSMNTAAINAGRCAARAQAASERQDEQAVAERRQRATAAYEALRARIVRLGSITPAGIRILERFEWRTWGEVQRQDAAARAVGQRYIAGEPGAGAQYEAALARCEWAWTSLFALLRRHEGR